MNKRFFTNSKRKMLFDVYLLLFVFVMINREFLFFGLDLRYVLVPFGVIVLLYSLVYRSSKQKVVTRKVIMDNIRNANHRNNSNGVSGALVVFYLFVALSNVSWLWNGLSIRTETLNEWLLIGNMLIALLVFHMNAHLVSRDRLCWYAVASCAILALSMVLVYHGLSLSQIGGSPDVPYIYHGIEGAHHYNLYGEDFRVAGYASDPNYATILLMIGVICVVMLKCKWYIKAAFLTLFVFGITLSFSKTIVLASVLCVLYLVLSRMFHLSVGQQRLADRLAIGGLATIVLISPLFRFFDLPLTLKLRFEMWAVAEDLFFNSFLIGSGITSFRSYFSTMNSWYVHCHSTYWQILSETGIVGFFLYMRVVFRALDQTIRNDDVYVRFLVLVFLVWAATYETIALPLSVFILLLININNKEVSCSKRALFFVNSLKRGGAERVCVHLARELIAEDYDVDFVVISNDGREIFTKDDKTNMYRLAVDMHSKLFKIISIPRAIFQVNTIVIDGELKNGEYGLITSHLPISNLIARYSYVRNMSIYVFHNTVESYIMGGRRLFGLVMRYLFNYKKVVAVSAGLRKEIVDDYGFNGRYVKLIYNPVDVVGIRASLTDAVTCSMPYIMHVGRFTEQKRQDRMLEIFYNGKFYNEYKLVFCGDGENKPLVLARANELGISDKVDFVGWREDLYQWMKNAKLLVCTSDYEAFGMVIAESLACGTGVVSSNCKFGPDEILTGALADFLVEPDDIDGYIVRINKALTRYSKIDESVFDKFAPEKIVGKYIDFYKER